MSVLGTELLAGGVTGFGLNEQETRFGSPTQSKLTGLLKPPIEVIVHVDVPVPPRGIVRVEGEHTMEKSPVGEDCVVKLNVAEYDPGPQEFTARARQKYVVLFASAGETGH